MRVVIALALAVAAPTAYADVQIQNDRSYAGQDGTMRIVGEIINGLDAPLGQAVVRAHTFEGSLPAGSGEAGSLVNIIGPGMSGPFEIILPEAGRYELELYYTILSHRDRAIEVTGSEMAGDGHGNLWITGTVANRGEITANTVSVVATTYGRDGSVSAVSRVHPEPGYLRAGGEAYFAIGIPNQKEAARYTLVAESEEYAAVPEFPGGMLIVVAGALAPYILASRRARIFIAAPTLEAHPSRARGVQAGSSCPAARAPQSRLEKRR